METAHEPDSGVPEGQNLIRDRQARGVTDPPPRRRGRAGLDLDVFARTVVAQRGLRRAGGVRTLGPMPVDFELMRRLDVYAERYKVSRRQVVECLLAELLAGERPPAEEGERG